MRGASHIEARPIHATSQAMSFRASCEQARGPYGARRHGPAHLSQFLNDGERELRIRGRLCPGFTMSRRALRTTS